MATAFFIEYPTIIAVEVAGSAKHPKLKRVEVGDLAEARTEDGNVVVDTQQHLNEQVKAFLKERKLTGGKAYLAVGPDAMRYRTLHLAFTDERKIRQVLPFQVEGAIPSIPIEDLALGHQTLRKDDDGVRVLVHAADKDYIRKRITALDESGVTVEAADSHKSGTQNLGLLHETFAVGSEPALWIDFAGTTSMVSVVAEGEVLSTRVFVSPYLAGATGQTSNAQEAKDAGKVAAADALDGYVLATDDEASSGDTSRGEAIDESETLPGNDSVSLPENESVNIGAAQVADRIHNMSRDELLKFVNRVSVEARRTLFMSQVDAAPTRLVVSGLGKEGGRLAELLGNELRLENTESIDLMDSIVPRDRDGNPKVEYPDLGAITYLSGVAIKGVGRDYTKIDFRYGDLAAGTMFDYAKTPLAFTATLVLLFAGIMFLLAYSESRRYEGYIASIRDNELGPKYWFDRSYEFFDKKTQGKELPTKYKKTVNYTRLDEDPAQEIRNTEKKLKDHLTWLQGNETTDYVKPWPADEILKTILATLDSAKPSYDFAILSLNIQDSSVRLEIMVSLQETNEERKKLGAPNMPEDRRVIEALRKMVEAHPKWFESEARETGRAKTETGSDGRQAKRMTLTIPLNKPAVPKKTVAKSRRSS